MILGWREYPRISSNMDFVWSILKGLPEDMTKIAYVAFFYWTFYCLSHGEKCFNFVKKLVGSVFSSEF